MSARLRTLRWVAVPFLPRGRVKTTPRRVHMARYLIRKSFSTTARTASLRDIVVDVDDKKAGSLKRHHRALPSGPQSGIVLADILMDQTLIVPSVHRVMVSCSWVRPTRSACLGFEDENAAQRVYQWFNDGGPYTVADRKVQAESPIRERDPQKPWAWTVVLTGVPVKASKQDVGATIPEASKPSHISLGERNYDINPNKAAVLVKSMLLQVGPVDRCEVLYNSEKTVKVLAWFAHEVYAEKAMFALHKVPLPFWPEGKLSILPMTEVKYKVSTPIYNAVQKRLLRLHGACREKDVHLGFGDVTHSSQHRYLTLVSRHIGALVKSKGLLERVLFDGLVGQEARGPPMGIPKKLLVQAQRRQKRTNTKPARAAVG